MEGINTVQRSQEELEKARILGEYFKDLAHQEGGVDSERNRIDELVQKFKDGHIKTLEDLEAEGNSLIDGRQGDH